MATGVAISTLIAASLSGSEAVGGIAQTCAVLGAGVLAVPMARLAARRGRRPALLLGYGTGMVGAALAAVAVALGSWPLLLAALVLFGGGSTANLAARYAATDLAEPTRRARALSAVVWCTTIGAVAGPNLADPASQLATALGVPAGVGPFLLGVVAFGLAALGIAVGLRPDPLVLARTMEAEPAASTSGSGGQVERGGVWRMLSGSARLGMVGIMVCHTTMVGLMSMTPVHMGHGGASLRIVGVVISLHIAGMYAASPLFGWLADRLGRVWVLALGAALTVASAGIAGMAPAHDAPQLAVGLVLLGLGWSAGLVAGSALLTESVPLARRPAVQGLSDLVMNVGGAVGGLAAGVLVTAASYAVLGLVVGFVALPLLVVCVAHAARRAE
ncbi:Predicted arabinose efflux permease, MFS family [Streptoalloteichus hindustanus]|uniref:Predicted arabinose efflux permease, MFS family n=2 Tax=Streptoalloteichus hindustanus TaxID=2017 RepID=A0A1M5BA14_STRHI|nr:Predicted arabinose efflux permease, MFS family [Streptoalloteichus hindustanus]